MNVILYFCHFYKTVIDKKPFVCLLSSWLPHIPLGKTKDKGVLLALPVEFLPTVTFKVKRGGGCDQTISLL